MYKNPRVTEGEESSEITIISGVEINWVDIKLA